VAGPIDTDGLTTTLVAPDDRGVPLFLFCLVLDGDDGACATTLPFKTAD
jgi:hypothetical protein